MMPRRQEGTTEQPSSGVCSFSICEADRVPTVSRVRAALRILLFLLRFQLAPIPAGGLARAGLRCPLTAMLFAFALILGLPARESHAEENPSFGNVEKPATDSPPPSSWSMLLLGGAMREHKDDILLRYGIAGFEHTFSDRFSGLVELVRYDVKQEPGGTTDGLGLNLLAGLNLYRTQRFVFFGAAGLGIADFERRMPLPDGTHFNFTIHGRLGLRWLLGDRFWLQAAAQYMHLSNADMEGEARNPSFDGFGGYGGLVVQF
jgi:hypothetical protein